MSNTTPGLGEDVAGEITARYIVLSEIDGDETIPVKVSLANILTGPAILIEADGVEVAQIGRDGTIETTGPAVKVLVPAVGGWTLYADGGFENHIYDNSEFGLQTEVTDAGDTTPGRTPYTGDVYQLNGTVRGRLWGVDIDGSQSQIGSLAVAGESLPTNPGVATPLLKLTPTAASGAPATGAHQKGEVVMDSAGALFVCQADGTPGTWKTITLT